ncbi:MAG TPA: hypothetical protein VM387_03730, partial [Gemmatimonadales bacterium]|nr:hypothetical protein [Gemmatimonadales bacterium]
CIAVDHDEDSSTFVAMISRILHLLVVDMVSVGLAVRRMPEGTTPSVASDSGDVRGQSTPGVWISHIG